MKVTHTTVETVKHVADGIAITTWVGHVAGVLSTFIIPILTAIWLGFRIFDLYEQRQERKKEKAKEEKEQE